MALSFALLNLIDDLDSVDAQHYLRAEAARKKDSSIRKVLESGISGLGDLQHE